jgi:hypothetical protein
MEHLRTYGNLEWRFSLFERAAAKGHEESIWISSVVKDVEMVADSLKEAFADTEEPLGWYFAGFFSEWDSRERFDFMKKSAEAGCSWGQMGYGWYFKDGDFVEKDKKAYLDWLEKAANQNNPEAMDGLGDWFREEEWDHEKAVSYYRGATVLGYRLSMWFLREMLQNGEGCEKYLRHAAMWSMSNDPDIFWMVVNETIRIHESGGTQKLDCNFDQLCYSLGWGLYWNSYEAWRWDNQSDASASEAFGNRCLDYYCSCVELQQKSIFTFLLCWNRTTRVKGPGQIIAQMVWEGREDNLISQLEQPPRRSARLKRIKK